MHGFIGLCYTVTNLAALQQAASKVLKKAKAMMFNPFAPIGTMYHNESVYVYHLKQEAFGSERAKALDCINFSHQEDKVHLNNFFTNVA